MLSLFNCTLLHHLCSRFAASGREAGKYILVLVFSTDSNAGDRMPPFLDPSMAATLSYDDCITAPEFLTIRAKIEVECVTADHSHISFASQTLPIYATADFNKRRAKTIRFVSDGLIRGAEGIKRSPLVVPGKILYQHHFMTIDRDINLMNSPHHETPYIGLGGFWNYGCPLKMMEQVYVKFACTGASINYHLRPLSNWRVYGEDSPAINLTYNNFIGIGTVNGQPLGVPDALCEGGSHLWLFDSTQQNPKVYFHYNSLGIERHGPSYAWITYRLLQQQVVNSEPDYPILPYLQASSQADADLTSTSGDNEEWFGFDELASTSNMFGV
ncbi:hypothetical protein [Candidatus Odyssella thessalonicensis]|uniref:hypothetical protein n=1 Tax=Candidatus Odyssella thessalonicensis TaxID=84647 RepID=UPI000225BF77|nr:hypothetical protein [Candidatus Odyssella thessalonicensis]